jgi:DNA-binding transcriptional LysR family regulator
MIRLAELVEDAFIVGSSTAEDALMRATFPPGFQPRIDIVAADWTGKLGCVAAELGVALIPALAIRSAPADITLLRTHPADASTRRIFAATIRGRKQSPAVASFVAQLRSEAKAMQVRMSQVP